MAFYSYYQHRQSDDESDLIEPAVVVIVEAPDTAHANLYAEQMGCYFDGVYTKRDAVVDRWTMKTSDLDEGDPQPTAFGQVIENFGPPVGQREIPDFVIRYLDGTVEVL